MLNDAEALRLGRSIVELVESRGLGALSKKDFELLVYHHLSASSGLAGCSLYKMANLLKVPETRIKAMRLESSLRHNTTEHKATLKSVVERIISAFNHPDFDGRTVAIQLEDPVERREFEYAAKSSGWNVEYGLNREILRISPLALFEIMLASSEDPEEKFQAIVRTCLTNQERLAELFDGGLTLRERVGRLGEAINEKSGLLSLLWAGVAATLG